MAMMVDYEIWKQQGADMGRPQQLFSKPKLMVVKYATYLLFQRGLGLMGSGSTRRVERLVTSLSEGPRTGHRIWAMWEELASGAHLAMV